MKRVRRSLLGLILAIFGCPVDPPPPLPSNEPPFLIQGSWRPESPFTFTLDGGCGAVFAVTVSDPDARDQILRPWWLLDGKHFRSTQPTVFKPGEVQLRLLAGELGDGGVHRLLVRITDTTFLEDGGAAPRDFGQLGQVEGGQVSFEWTVITADSGC
ncbi:MAG: hypothetical protein JNJ54_33855 [Myxococcaceae bacterium]|nr:hypothetical protein [Myxococcaceae bacterium]